MAMTWVKSSVRPPRVFDPYYDWAAATKFAYYGKAVWLPVLIELHEARSLDFADRVFRLQGRDWAGLLRIPPVFRAPPKRLRGKQTRFLTALAKREFFARLYRGDEPSAEIKRFELSRAVDLPANMVGDSGWGSGTPDDDDVPPSAVVIGVIDDGLAFAHDRFRDGPTSTRIHYFWDQMVPAPFPGTWPYGREICKHDTGVLGIDTRLANCRHAGLVDEDELYRGAGYLDYSQTGYKAFARRGAHGTHVMDLACNPPAQGIGPIIAVQLPSETTADTSGATLTTQVIDALWYMLLRAEDIAAANGIEYLPLVVNLSYGMIAGPHDGTGELEQAIDELATLFNTDEDRPLLRVVLPSGNSHLSRCHARFSLAPKAPPRDLHWRVLPDDWTESFLEIWYPDQDDSGGNSNLQITVTAPDGSATLAFGVGTSYQWQPNAGVPAGLVSFYPAAAGSSQRLIRLSLAPTHWPDGALTLAPAGLWRISVQNVGNGCVNDIHAWIQRDDTPVGYSRRGRQSYFDDPQYAVFDDGGRPIESDTHALTAMSYVERRATLNAIATGTRTVVIAGMRRSDWTPAAYSASGPPVSPARGGPNPNGPDAMTVSDDSPSHHGLLAAGSRSGSCLALYGTSVAAPQITRWIADDLLAGGPGGRQDVANLAANPPAPPPPGRVPTYTEGSRPASAAAQPTAERGGAGRIDLPPLRLPRFER
jgi:hypothetical protein